MSRKYENEITANMERAEESLKAAKDLARQHYYDITASRTYYVIFYAATALLLSEELTFRKHSAVISAIHKNFVKTGKLDKQFGKDLNWLFELRSVADYGVTTHVPKKDAEQAVETAEKFLQAIKNLL